MKEAIWKYQLKPRRNSLLKMPKGAVILSAQKQHDTICVWAMVNPEVEELEERLFQVFGTGETMPDDEIAKRIHIDTVQMQRGHLVFHVFESIVKK